jgi:uncharacterized protein (TIGR02118 family)
MYQLIALFREPKDTLAFDAAYADLHLPLARKIPGLHSLTVSRIVPSREGKAKYYQMSVLNFADRDGYKTAMKSPENAEAGRNLEAIAPGIVEFYTAETLESA